MSFLNVIGLFLNGSSYRANVSASTALSACIRINYIHAVAFGNSTARASVAASAASYTSVSNLISHDKYLQLVLILTL